MWLLEGEKNHGILKFVKAEGAFREIKTRFAGQYCWLCDKRIPTEADVAWLAPLNIGFHLSCWNEL